MSKITLKCSDSCDFKGIFKIMAEAFPASERRTEEKQLALFNNVNYKPYVFEKDGVLIGFILAWEISDFRFIEHFAVEKSYRGSGIGSRILSEYLLMNEKPVCLEVEPPLNSISERRIAFYKRLGFTLNNFEYFQPALQPGQKEVELKIMSYPKILSKEQFDFYRKRIFNAAYGNSSVYMEGKNNE